MASEMYLTEDLLIEIVRRLDVKSVVRCIFVCKTWHDIILNSTSLVKDHLTNQKTSPDAKKYVLHEDSKGCKLLADSEPLLDGTKQSKLYYTPNLFEKDNNTCDGCQLRIHGMCDGLICISNDRVACYRNGRAYFECKYYVGDNLYLWNPICRKAKKLPELKISNNEFTPAGGVSFGYYGDDYKVIVISCHSSFGWEYIVSVYSLSINCWKTIHTNCYYDDKRKFKFDIMYKQPTKFIDGIAYMITWSLPYLTGRRPLIVCFDLRDETIQEIKCPKVKGFVGNCTCLTVEAFGETIAVMGCYRHMGYQYLVMWTLLRDKFPSKLRWEKKLFIKLEQVHKTGYDLVGFLHNDKYMIMAKTFPCKQSRFLLCDLESEKLTEYRSRKPFNSYGNTIDPNCGESLLLLNEDSVNPFARSETESSSSSVFTLDKVISPPKNASTLKRKKGSRGNRRKKRARG